MDSGEKKNILVVDDDREIVRAIALNLESEGYNVFKAYDGMEALDLAMTKDIHLILIDVMMPKLDGLSAIMKIRERKNLPIIVLSAKSEDSDKVIGLSMGADDYVTKPFNPMELTARVKSQLRRYTSLGDIHSSGENTIVNGRLTFFKAFPNAPLYIFRKTTAFFLCKAGENGQHQFAITRQGIDVLFFKSYFNTDIFQMPYRFQKIHCVSGKS